VIHIPASSINCVDLDAASANARLDPLGGLTMLNYLAAGNRHANDTFNSTPVSPCPAARETAPTRSLPGTYEIISQTDLRICCIPRGFIESVIRANRSTLSRLIRLDLAVA